MNIYPPLLLAPGFPYLAAGKLFPAPSPGGPPSSPSHSPGTGRAAEGFWAARGRLHSCSACDPARPRTACLGYLVPVSACASVCVTKRACARALRTFPDFSLGRPGFLASAFLCFPLLSPPAPPPPPPSPHPQLPALCCGLLYSR